MSHGIGWRSALSWIAVGFVVSGVVNTADTAAPDMCRTSFDAVARVRGELFFFKNHYFWRLDRHGRLQTPHGVLLEDFWTGLPATGRIDAAYERPDGAVVFFSGRYFWVVWDRHTLPGHPRPLTDLGFPEETASVDAAFTSGHNRATYLVTDTFYWRFNELQGRVEQDSPQALTRLCRGLPGHLDAAFHTTDGASFFIQGQHYWRCDLEKGAVQSYAPDLVAPRWLGCSLVQCCLQQIHKEIDTRVEKVLYDDAPVGGWEASQRKTGNQGNGAQSSHHTARMSHMEGVVWVVLVYALIIA